MPVYEYKCQACGSVFEVRQKFSDEPLATHDRCGGRVERLISAPALHFKGSGWYVNDYGKGKGNGSPPREPKPAAKSEPKPDAKADSAAPATPPPPK